MKKTITLVSIGVLFLIAAVAPAGAAKPKSVKTTLYMHGNNPVGESEFATFLTDGTYMTMDTTEPASGGPKSQSYWFSANESCVGNPLYPSWEAKMAGLVTGDLKILTHTLGAPATLNVRVWKDVPFMSCTSSTAGTDAFVEPVLQQQVELAPGLNETEIVFKKVKLPVTFNLIVQIHTSALRSQGRILYDSAEFPTRVEFDCAPVKGSKTCA
jgi:hypothetical protein